MLMGAAHNALWAFNARVSLTLPVCHRPQAATLALRSGAVRSPVTVVPSCGLETRSWRTGRMARHKQECIRLPYTAALASQRAFFICNILKRIATASRNTVRYKFLFSFTEQMYSNVKIVSILDCQHACIRQNFCVRICNYIGIMVLYNKS